MEPIATAQSIRDAEAAWFAAHPGGDLMGLAAAAVAQSSAELLAGRERLGVLVVAGPGNNAGDALFAAAGLPELTGVDMPIWVWPVAGTTHHDGLAAALAVGAVLMDSEDALQLCSNAGLLIDGVSGLGGRPGLTADVAAVARAAQATGIPVLAVDIPSGLVADSGEGHESFVADLTVTFIAKKLAHVAEPAASACGRVELVDIGVALPPGTLTNFLKSRNYDEKKSSSI
ncbi:MAG: NAD(P)H-hydrate epimerase [Brooklawnia sp.]|jgi:hydroxyethylthiazole kinase-like uncharacterized protein yjeF